MPEFLFLIIIVLLLYIFLGLLRPLRKLRDYQPQPDDEGGLFSHGWLRPSSLFELEQRLRDAGVVEDRLRRELETQRRLNSTIFNSLDAALVLSASNLEILFANGVFKESFAPEEPAVGRSLMEVCVHHEIEELAQRALSTGHSQTMQFDLEVYEQKRLVTKNFRVRAQLADVESVGEDPKLLFVMEDVTRLRELETIRRDFVANASHELRTPLSIISGYIENLLDGAIEDRDLARRFLVTMQKHSIRLTSIVKDLLTVSRLENYSFSLELETLQLDECVSSVEEQLQPLIRSSGAVIETNWQEKPFLMRGDRYCFDQIFFNLIENSLKHNSSDDLRIVIEAGYEGDDAVIVYRDNGSGIPMQDQPFVFNRFYRVTRAGRNQAEGTGLGLSIVKKAIDAHGGQVQLESRAGAGVTIRMRLPAHREAPTAALPG